MTRKKLKPESEPKPEPEKIYYDIRVQTKVDLETKRRIKKAANTQGMTEAMYVRWILMNNLQGIH